MALKAKEQFTPHWSRAIFRFFVLGVAVCAVVVTAEPTAGQQPPAAATTARTAAPIADSVVVSPEVISSASSHHALQIGDVTLPYTATWSSTALKDDTGIAQATISATSYVRDDSQNRARRPAIFAFNGGPGASSSPLHFGILGPRRTGALDSHGPPSYVDNAETLLDAADLVLIDPVGTGFSRQLRPDGGHAYWSPEGDAKATLQFIRGWLHDNNRTSSPIYLIGESYGGYRVAEMAKELADLNVAGIVLISPGLDLSGEAGITADQQFVFTLPSMTTTAFVHGKSQANGRSVEEVFEEARAFAQSDYIAALELGSELPAPERDRLAERMAKLIGLPASTISAANLRVDTQDFLEQLLPGKVMGRIDTRVAAAKPEGPLVAGRPKAADDPALRMGKSNVIKSPRVRDYLRNEIGVKTDLDYVALTLDVNFAWDWNSGSHKIEDILHNLNPTPNLAKLMKEKPSLRLLLLSGYYDLATPVLYQRYAMTHSGIPLDRTRMVAFAAGHTVYDDDTRKQVSKELHDFVAATSGTMTQ